MITWWKDPHKESETQDQEGNTQVEFDTSHDEYGLLERVAGPKEGAEIEYAISQDTIPQRRANCLR